ncbi:MAG: hypothetical protein KatS3mg050_1844 [Litorilinea sp.]|nr:MAG: hypothetical protein KatS3mg050_1844 [Litorilinea sp.]
MTGNDGARLPSPDHVAVELARLRAENARLRRALRINGRHSRRVQRAYDAALLLATWHVAYLDTTRAACRGRGMPQRQWENGMALLRLARVVDERGRWLVHDLATVEPALQRARDRAVEVPEALFARGPRHMRG